MNKEFKVKDIFQPQQVSEKLRKQEVLFTWNDGAGGTMTLSSSS